MLTEAARRFLARFKAPDKSLKRYTRSANNYTHLGVAAVFSKEDAAYVRRSCNRDRYDTFNERLVRRFNDQTAWDDLTKRHVDPLEVQVVDKLVVNGGLTRMAELGVGATTNSWTHMASGTGQTAEGASQVALVTESKRISLITDGDRFPSGTSMKFAGFFDSSSPTATIWEAGIFDANAAGIMFLRAKYLSSLSHTLNVTVYTLNETVNQTAS